MKTNNLTTHFCVLVLLLILPATSFARFKLENQAFLSAPELSTLQILNVENQGNEKTFPKFAPVIGITAGVLFGLLLGAGIGLAIPADYSQKVLENGLNGALIGATVLPFINFELATNRKGKIDERNSWAIHTGVNRTTSNHSRTIAGMNYTFGVNRYYHGKHFDLVGGLSYSTRSLKLPNQKVLYRYPSETMLRMQDIHFSVGYIDVQLVSQYNFQLQSSRVSIGAGPVLYARVYENTKSTYFSAEKVEEMPADYDFFSITDEPPSSMPYFGYTANIKVELKKVFARLSFKKAFRKTMQMSPIDDATQLQSIEFTLGYIFKR